MLYIFLLLMKKQLRKFFTSGKSVWVFTFLAIFIFITFASSTNLSAQESNTALDVYLRTSDNQSGFLVSTFSQTTNLIIGDKSYAASDAAALDTGAVGALTKLTDDLYAEPPASGIVWAFDQIQLLQGNTSITVNAQDASDTNNYFPGLGFNILRPTLGLWQWSRNLVYFFFIIIMVVIAFLILFRQSLGGGTMVTIVNSLPSIMWALLLVTLSYPICGLFIDVITIGSNFVQGVMISSPGTPGNELINSKNINPDGDKNDVNYLQPDDKEVSIWNIWFTSKANICEGSDNCENLESFLPDVESNGFINAVGSVLTGTLEVKLGSNPLFVLLVSMAVLQSSFKLFTELLKNYVYILLSPIFSPFIFLTAAFPNKTGSTIMDFIKRLTAASGGFIGVYAVFLLMVIIGRSDEFTNSAFKNIADFRWAPPLLGYTHDQILATGSSTIKVLIIYMLFMLSPSIPEMINNLFQVQPANQYLSQVGQKTAAGIKQSIGVGKSIFQAVTSKH